MKFISDMLQYFINNAVIIDICFSIHVNYLTTNQNYHNNFLEPTAKTITMQAHTFSFRAMLFSSSISKLRISIESLWLAGRFRAFDDLGAS